MPVRPDDRAPLSFCAGPLLRDDAAAGNVLAGIQYRRGRSPVCSGQEAVPGMAWTKACPDQDASMWPNVAGVDTAS